MTKQELKEKAVNAWMVIYDAGDSALDALDCNDTYNRLFDECGADVERMIDQLSLEDAEKFVFDLEEIASEAEFF